MFVILIEKSLFFVVLKILHFFLQARIPLLYSILLLGVLGERQKLVLVLATRNLTLI